MTSATIQSHDYCPYCGKWKLQSEVQHIVSVVVCFECLEWSRKAMDILLHGKFPEECQICHRSATDMAAMAEASGDQMRMAVVEKDGIYQATCLECAMVHAGKRRDLYGNTPFGKSEGIE